MFLRIKSIPFALSMLCIPAFKAQEPRALIGHNRNLKTTKFPKSPKGKGKSANGKGKSPKTSDSPSTIPSSTPSSIPKKRFLEFAPGGRRMLKEVSDSQERLVEIVSDLGGNLDGKFGIVEDLLSSQECASLREYADSELVEALKAAVQEEEHDIQENFRFEVSPSKLASLIDVDSIRSMHKAFKDYGSDFPVSRVIIRRTSLTGNKHIQYHNDGDTSVMQVWLNEEDTVDGGNLVYLNKDGAHLVPTKPGSANLHKDKIVHGITPVNGTSYILIFLGDNRFESDVLESVVS